MDLSNLSERDRKTAEHQQQRLSDIKIVAGLISKNYSNEEIAEQMGTTVPHIEFLKKAGKLNE